MIVYSPSDGQPAPQPALELAELIQLCTACARRLRHVLAAEAGRHSLSDAAFAILWACYQAPPTGVSQKQLAQSAELSPARVSGLVEQLRQRDLIEGDRLAVDRRVQVWRLTAGGQSLVESVIWELQAWTEQLAKAWPAERRRIIAELLRDLNRQFSSQDEMPVSLAASAGAEVAR